MLAAPTRRRFTVQEFHHLGDVGILAPDDRVELLEGQIIEMAAIGSYDRALKLPRYGKAGIHEGWVVDLSGGFVQVFRDPVAGAGYAQSARFTPGETIESLATAGLSVGVDEVIGEPDA